MGDFARMIDQRLVSSGHSSIPPISWKLKQIVHLGKHHYVRAIVIEFLVHTQRYFMRHEVSVVLQQAS